MVRGDALAGRDGGDDRYAGDLAHVCDLPFDVRELSVLSTGSV